MQNFENKIMILYKRWYYTLNSFGTDIYYLYFIIRKDKQKSVLVGLFILYACKGDRFITI